ncbi:BppU family phage baseplate upper protein [Staphylococcus haemolyticus]|uniref:BppU family phage baseplate upper protein n=1 Tax=Staphylococcus haemolyticus TaxID=1283 RepID=UPI0011A6A198|nr:BppU family phage baseplate upper protein [Staphylococcus haemolyticus]
MIIKMTDVETHINPRNVDIGDIGSRFYTEDENTAFIRIRINYNGSPVDLTKTDMKPKLDLFMEDTSIFRDQKLEVLIPESGLIQYEVPPNVIKHIGKVNCKLFMDSPEHSVHVANFSFAIVDSGIEKAVAKEINLNLVKDTVKQILSEDLTTLLDDNFKTKLTNDLENYVTSHSEEFKGEEGDKGDDGLSAYQIAAKNGFSGTEIEWLSQINNNSIYLNHFNPDKTGEVPCSNIIQQALDLMKKFNIANLYIDNGTYLIDKRIYIYSDSNVIMSENTKLLRGHAGGFFDNGNPSAEVGNYDGESNISIIGGTLDNNYENISEFPTKQVNMIVLRHGNNINIRNVSFVNSITVHCIDVNGTKNLKIENCTFEGYINLSNADMKEAIQLSEYVVGGIDGGLFDGTPTQNVTISNCTFKESDILGGFNVCIGNHLTANDTFNNNINISNNAFRNCKIGIRVWKWKNTNISNNRFDNIEEALRVSSIGSSYQSANNIDGTKSGNSQAGENLTFIDNKIKNVKSVAIGIYGIQDVNTALFKNIFIKNNIISNNLKQSQSIILELAENIEISNNFIENIYRGISYKSCNFVRIINNTISNTSTEGVYNDIQTYSDGFGLSKNINIENNVINITGKNGIFLNSSNMFRIVGNIVNKSNNDNLGGALRGAIYANSSDYGRIENNMCFGEFQNFIVRLQSVNNSNVFNNSGNSTIRLDGTNNNTKKTFYDIDESGNVI